MDARQLYLFSVLKRLNPLVDEQLGHEENADVEFIKERWLWGWSEDDTVEFLNVLEHRNLEINEEQACEVINRLNGKYRR